MLPIDYQLNDGLQLRGMPVDKFAIVVKKEGIGNASKSRLFEAFRGVKALPSETAIACWQLWQEIEEMCQAAEPLQLDLSNGVKVHELLIERRRGKEAIAAIAEELVGKIGGS